MVEVTSGSSRGGAVSDTSGAPRTSFDLNSWQELTEVLGIARKAGLDGDSYNAFRDLIMQYAQSGGDASLKEKINAKLASLSIGGASTSSEVSSPEPRTKKKRRRKKKKPQNDEKNGDTLQEVKQKTVNAASQQSAPAFGFRARPTPTFGGQAATSAVKDNPAKERVKSAVSEPVVKREPSGPGADAVPINLPTESPKSGTSQAVPVADNAPTKKTVTELQRSAKNLEEHKARISEIKHSVNTQIGNPVSLIDSGNEIGRQYMNALLDAMKATTGGPAGSLDIAMAKLEKAYELMLEAIKDGTFKTAEQQHAPETPPKAEESVPKRKEEPVRKEPESEERSGKVVDSQAAYAVASESLSPPKVSEVSRRLRSSSAGIPSLADLNGLSDRIRERMAKDEEEKKIEPMPEVPEAPPSPEPPQIAKYESAPSEEVSEKATETQRDESQQVPKIENEKKVVGQVLPSQKPQMASGASLQNEGMTETAKPTSAAPNMPLHRGATITYEPNQAAISSPEVTTALAQLLDEWSLFKGSGLFGMGPGGADSPLYKQLSELSMFAVLAGRWERSSPDLTKTIKDYVNAWRHEQGITYNPSETFEHYLRRVVLRILERQKQ